MTKTWLLLVGGVYQGAGGHAEPDDCQKHQHQSWDMVQWRAGGGGSAMIWAMSVMMTVTRTIDLSVDAAHCPFNV